MSEAPERKRYPKCADCKWERVSFPHWLFGDGHKYARCANPKTNEPARQEAEARYHLGKPPRLERENTESCRLLRGEHYPHTNDGRNCGPDARHFEPKGV